VEPVKGTEIMQQRTGKIEPGYSITRGPGNVSRALGIKTIHTGYNLLKSQLIIKDDGFVFDSNLIQQTPRIGVAYAGEDALLPYRFFIRNNKYVSGKKSENSF